MTFHVPTCVCGHPEGEHQRAGSRGLNRAPNGRCLNPKCQCLVFVDKRTVRPYDNPPKAA